MPSTMTIVEFALNTHNFLFFICLVNKTCGINVVQFEFIVTTV